MKREPDFNAFPAATFEDWAALAEKSLDGRTVSDALTSRTRDDLTIPPVLAANSGDTHVARQFPDRPWRITVRVDDPSGHAAAEQAVNDLEGGADALALVLPSAATADGFGICATDLELLDGALAGVDLSLVQVRLEPTWDAAQDAALMQALITSRAHAAADVDITFGFDPVGSLARAGAIPANWADVSEHLSADVTQLKKSGFEGPFAVADGRLVHAAGGTPAQELAFALATATTYLRALSDRNSSLDDADAEISRSLPTDQCQP
ncbi:MAG: methylmalonyl-CoA mutase family protein [Pseudomonadota bacterium]